MNEHSPTHTAPSMSLNGFVTSWGSLEDCLTLLAGTPERGALIPETVSALRKAQAAGEPSSRTLLRVLAATAFLTDDRPLGAPMDGIGAMS